MPASPARSARLTTTSTCTVSETEITFVRLPEVPLDTLAAHMSDPRTGAHMPLLAGPWGTEEAAAFVAAKEATWARDGLGHWAILIDNTYAGWGGFQKEGVDWDFGLVLRPEFFSLGRLVFETALAWLSAHRDVREVTFLLPQSRSRRVPLRLGAQFRGDVTYAGTPFTKWSLPVPRKLASDKPPA